MALRLKIVSSHRNALAERSVKEFGRDGGTIGRSLESDWVLPDMQRYVSSRHASIDFRSGSYYIVDTSTNGVYVNGADKPVGRGKPQRLFSGDRIKIGEFEMVAEVEEESSVGHLIDEDHVDPVDLAQRVEAPEPAGEDLVDAFEITGVGIEMELSDEELETLIPPSKRNVFVLELEDAPDVRAKTKPQAGRPLPKSPAPAAKPAAGATMKPVAADAVKRAPAASDRPTATATTRPTATASAKPTATASAKPAATARAKPAATTSARPAAPTPSTGPAPTGARAPGPPALGHEYPATNPLSVGAAVSAGATAKPRLPQPTASVTRVPAGKTTQMLEPFFRGAGIRSQRVDTQQADLMLLCLGQLMREMIVGIGEILHQRAEQKNALRLPSTTIQPGNNNPLKFSAGVEETLLNLLLRDSPEYLLPVEAVREAFGDIKQHQLLLLKSLRGALDDFVGRLDPDDLEQKFSRGRSGMLLNAANKLKYWDLYKDIYQLVASHPPGELPMQFLDDFAHAYEQESARAANSEPDPAAEAKAAS
jgi:type VI secretion system protein